LRRLGLGHSRLAGGGLAVVRLRLAAVPCLLRPLGDDLDRAILDDLLQHIDRSLVVLAIEEGLRVAQVAVEVRVLEHLDRRARIVGVGRAAGIRRRLLDGAADPHPLLGRAMDADDGGDSEHDPGR
jgi:hypothetical protein